MSARSRVDNSCRDGWVGVWQDNRTANGDNWQRNEWWTRQEQEAENADAWDDCSWSHWSQNKQEVSAQAVMEAEPAAVADREVDAEQAAVADNGVEAELAAVADSNVVQSGCNFTVEQIRMASEGRTPISQAPDANFNQITDSQVVPTQVAKFHSMYTGTGFYRKSQTEDNNAGAPTAVAAIPNFSRPNPECNSQLAYVRKSALKKKVIINDDQVPDGGTGSATKGSDHRNQTESGIVSAGSDRHHRNQTAAGNACSSTAVSAAGVAEERCPMPTRQCPNAVAAVEQLFADRAATEALARRYSENSIFPLTYFLSHPVLRQYSVHNHALKYFRETAEAQGDGVSQVEFPCDKVRMRRLVKGGGEEFHFEGEETVEWHWHEMVAQLDHESLGEVVEGEQTDANRSLGLVKCRLQKRHKDYDHKRMAALKKQGQPMAITLHQWDFVLVRQNGTEVWLHPSFSSKSVECLLPQREQENAQFDDIPQSGPGGTSGPGTFRYHKTKNLKKMLQFKSHIVNGNGKGKGR